LGQLAQSENPRRWSARIDRPRRRALLCANPSKSNGGVLKVLC